MAFTLVPGNALGCSVNSHRSRWDGSICEQAASWNCGAEGHFREDYCERKDPRCFHMHAFSQQDPYLVIPQSGVGWILESNPTAMAEQLLLLWGSTFSEPHGVREGTSRNFHVFGAYRVQSIERIVAGPHIHYHVHPYPDGWAEFHELRIQRPYYQTAGGAYVKQVERRAVDRVFQEAWAAAELKWKDPAQIERKKRLQRFHDYLDEWFRVANGHAQKLRPKPVAAPKGLKMSAATTPNRPFRSFTKLLESKVVEGGEPPPPPTRVTVKAEAASTVSARHTTDHNGQLVETSMRQAIVERYGEDALTAILVGSLTKPLLVFRGEPGVGKSTLALNLLHDPKRERTIVVPVSSTWRGREDLLGYVNPIDNSFAATNFTRFLYSAQTAWDKDDRRNRLVVFEEFNLSQPEYWLSDVLVRCQYPADNRQERTIELGGNRVSGMKDVDSAGVFLAPSIRFVATINSDLTTRPLSPRVLDRIAVVELSMEPSRALDEAGVELEETQVSAIADLSFLIKPKGATFSLRSAISLRQCLDHLEHLEITRWDALDLVLLQEVLTKVRLLSGDPGDHQLLRELGKWADAHGVKLRRCAGAIATWKEMLEEGQDVTQA
ncbi:MAG: hypothetical protein CMJ83_21280 [Planctomycetes bacterium]|nr:hypothetical protein [Planctomycetota bacterium]